MGSGLAVARGTLTGGVSASGAVSLTFNGKAAKTLQAGKYTVKVTDASKADGFLLVKGKRTVAITGAAFVGKHTGTVTLTAGKWALDARSRRQGDCADRQVALSSPSASIRRLELSPRAQGRLTTLGPEDGRAALHPRVARPSFFTRARKS